MIERNLKACLLASGVALALAAGVAVAQSGTSQPAETPPSAVPPTQAPPPDTQPTVVPPASSTSTPATQSSSATPTDRPATAIAPQAASIATFDDLDINKDSGLGKDEVIGDSGLSNSFAMYDSDNDGKLSRDEFAKYKASKHR